MSNQIPESDPQIPVLLPATDEPLSDVDALAALENALETFPNQVDLVVSVDPPQPVGRSVAYDFATRSLIKSSGQLGPTETRGLATLGTWIEKCLRTARGAHAIHPAGYGLPASVESIIGTPVGTIPADLEQRIREALTFHPRISDIESFSYDWEDDDDVLQIFMVIVLDDDSRIPIGIGNLEASL